MPQHAETRRSPYSAQQLFDLVDDVKSYPQFLPWCLGARVKSQGPGAIQADLIVGFKGVRETFSSAVTSNSDGLEIQARLIRGPFEFLNTDWAFEDLAEGGSLIKFAVGFRFKSRLLATVVDPLFLSAQKRLVAAFEQRAEALYSAQS